MVAPRRGGHHGAMIGRRPIPHGTTAIELLFALVLLGVLLGLAYPPVRGKLDDMAVRSARESLAAGVARARAVAIARGGAEFVVDGARGRFWVLATTGDTAIPPVHLGEQYGVVLVVDGGATDVSIHFDGRGLGRVANRTFRLQRGKAEARLTLSAYGRPRRW